MEKIYKLLKPLPGLKEGAMFYKSDSYWINSNSSLKFDDKEISITAFFKPIELEENKWYKFLWNSSYYYGKISFTKTRAYLLGDVISFSETVLCDKWNQCYVKNSAVLINETSNWDKAELYEIKPYLPNGHPDKTISLEKEEYYLVKEDGFWMIGKAENNISYVIHKDGNVLRGNVMHIIDSKGKYVENTTWCFYDDRDSDSNKIRTFTKLDKDSDEVKWLQVCENAREFVPKQTALDMYNMEKMPCKKYDITQIKNALHSVEIKHNKSYSDIFYTMLHYLNESEE